MDIEVMGVLDVQENGVSITPTAPKPRQLLALLALRADRPVPVATLMEELWGSTPPRSARTTLQTYVLQLRELIERALGRGRGRPRVGARGSAKSILVTVPGGYLLDSGGGSSDVREFEELTSAGYRAVDAGDFQGAVRQLKKALELWTGPPFADVPAGEHLYLEIRRLEEVRLCAIDQRISAELRLGRHRDLLSELTVLVNRHPAHENFHAQYMLALHRSGRRVEALEVYQNLRAALVRDLGLEPSADLQRIQRLILISGSDGSLVESVAGRSDSLVHSSC
ncbi:AfsR/SARP family transcriptional regulator [Streptomyces sp. NBC_00690]|uniref:AfsR/SARP family transcriptional regulator n=1 Tax=Streptomyces sp. NBC_00690 TaxID=2975808 RepID=UPI002E2CABEF|nr:AfsR/SARP family transcriptional regulator [Streptomyces sp. NBC_00690]